MSDPEVTERLDIGSGTERRSIAYLSQPGNAPGVIWLQGFRSEMTSIKATALAEWTAAQGLALTRFDYSGHGRSDGAFMDGTISRWLDEADAAYRELTSGPQVVVGSSMGGYLALLLVRRLLARNGGSAPERIKGLVLIAPAWDMTDLMWQRASPDVRRAILDDGVWCRPSAYDDGPYPITRGLIEDGRDHILGHRAWNPGCPVEIIHGRLDPDVPFDRSVELATMLAEAPARLTEVPDGEHRLSRPEDLAVLFDRIAALL